MSQKRQTNPLGKLTSFGLSDIWQVALLLPKDWDDMRQTVGSFTPEELASKIGKQIIVEGRLYGRLHTNYRPVPRVSGSLCDQHGKLLPFTCFGNTSTTEKQINGCRKRVVMFGKVGQFNGQFQLQSPVVVHPNWAGRLRPKYPGKPSVIGANKVRDRVIRHLRQALSQAECHISDKVAGGDWRLLHHYIKQAAWPDANLHELLIKAHVPRDEAEAHAAQDALSILNAIAVIKAADSNRKVAGTPGWQLPPFTGSERAQKGLPFALNADQHAAINDILTDLSDDACMHRLLTGDVGTGKTAVYGTALMVAASYGARVAVLAPNTGLVKQIYEEIRSYWPDLDVFAVTGSTRKNKDLTAHQVLIGTTALLHRNPGTLNFVIVDEQHKFSRTQREQLRVDGCHLLEATATCTPRSQALKQLGITKVSQLRMRPQTNRKVVTTLYQKTQRHDLMQAIKASVAAGHQVLIVYPEKGSDTEQAAAEDVRRQAAGAYQLWQKHFPGRVRLSHGGLTDTDKNSALTAMKTRQADILVSTTVVEVGITIKGLMRVVVIHADRLGMVTLHQIRGRVARAGGTGYCDLYVEELEKDSPAEKRLNVLCKTEDGFKVSEEDMRLRGFGDLSSSSQAEKGFLDGFLVNRPPTPQQVDKAMDILAKK